MSDITLYTVPTPNGYKVSVALELLGIKYEVKTIDMKANEQKEEWYIKICPNGRAPAIIDHKNNNFIVWESGAILIYLAENYDKENMLFPSNKNGRSEVIQWLMFQMSGVGPMMGQYAYFSKFCQEKLPHAIERYKNETLRLFSVLENRLVVNGDWLVGESITIADISVIPWLNGAEPFLNIELKNFPKIKDYIARAKAIKAVEKGLQTPKGSH